MPYTVNGFGTWYWGKDRIHTTAGQCEFCGHFGQLRSYDTSLYVVALFVPLVPLGRRRILNECPRCTKHRAISLKKWQELQARDIAAANEAASAEPGNEQKAAAAIGTAVAYEAEEEFELLAQKFDRTLPRAPLLQAAIATGYAYFGHVDRAETHFNQSLAAKDDPEVREALALLMLRSGRPADARPQLRHILDQRQTDKLPLLMVLVETYQALGQHAPALEVLDEIEAAFPDAATERAHRDARQASEKNRDTAKPVNSGMLKTLSPQAVQRGSRLRLLPRLIPPTIAAVLLGVYLVAAVQKGQSRPVHLVNGLGMEYDVEINGRTYALPAYAHRQINLAEGEVRIDVPRLKLTRTATLRTPFFSRPFRSQTFVLNPDGVALIAWEQIVYVSGNTAAADAAKPRLYTGRVLHELGSIDYPFSPPPEQLSSTSNASRILKSSARLIDNHGPADAAELVLEYAGEQPAAQLIRNWLEVEPDNPEALQLVPFLLSGDEAEQLLRPRLSERPVNVNWHRFYQEVMERHRPDHDLRGEYAAMLQKEPQDPALCYLLARATPERSEARRLLQRAIELTPPVAFAFYALGYDAASSGDFEAALGYSRRALALEPLDAQFAAQEMEALLALGRFDEALARTRARQLAENQTAELVQNEIYLLACTGEVAAARRRAESRVAVAEQEGDQRTAELLRAHYESIIAYVSGDLAAAMEWRAKVPGSSAQLECAVGSGRLSDAARAAEELRGSRADSYLMIYIAARLAGDEPAASRAIELAIQELHKGGYEERQIAGWLGSGRAPEPSAATHLLGRPHSKRLVLTALGLMYPELRESCFGLARTLNFDRRFPHLLIARATAAQ